jgi:serine/threonine-protein kinase
MTRKTIPAHVEAAVLKALAKLPADRFATAAELAAGLVVSPGEAARGIAFGAARSRWTHSTGIFAGLALTFAVALAVALAVLATRSVAPARTARVEVEVGAYFGSLNVPVVVGAPDGKSFVYCSGEGEVWSRRWASLVPTRVPDAGTGCMSAAFSPDGKQLAVIGIPTSLRIVSLAGDSPSRVLAVNGLDDLNSYGGGVDWASDGKLYIASRQGVTRLSPTDGRGTVVATMDSAITRVAGIDVLPGAHAALVVVTAPSPTGSMVQRIGVVDLRTGTTTLIAQGNAVRYAKPGYLLVSRDGALVALPFDLSSLRPSGPEVPLADSIAVRLRAGEGLLDVTDDGTLLYWRSAGTDLSHPVFVDRAGVVSDINPPQWIGRLSEPRLSNDGTLLAMEVGDGVRSEMWIRDLRSGLNTVVATGGLVNGRHSWKQPEGKLLTIVSTRTGSAALYVSPRYAGEMRPLPKYDPRPIFGSAWSRDGRWLILRTDDQAVGRGDILAVRPGIDSVARPIVATAFSEYSPALSPDGRWLAYLSNETGRYEVHVTPFPDARGQSQISTGGGTDPVWSHSGRELFFVSQGYLVAADIAQEAGFRVVGTRRLFPIAQYLTGSFARRYFDITPDDRHFVMLRRNEDLMTSRIVAVFNWSADLKSQAKR